MVQPFEPPPPLHSASPLVSAGTVAPSLLKKPSSERVAARGRGVAMSTDNRLGLHLQRVLISTQQRYLHAAQIPSAQVTADQLSMYSASFGHCSQQVPCMHACMW
mmetsp:Transcript_2577/g.5820  ORF Transcript_2577/g.5820 Transcript_2577/m.5820 type:complete len:105 (-) Transcript_2577:512-826(-)